MASFSGVSLIQSTFGNLEVVGVRGNQLVHLFRDAQFNWSGASVIAADAVRGTPSLIQSRFGDPGNFEVVVPSPGGGLMHFSRSNSDPNFPWSGATHFGDGEFSGVSLIESTFGNHEHLEVAGTRGEEILCVLPGYPFRVAWGSAHRNL